MANFGKMSNKFDLQIHSTASDGKYAPAEIIEIAQRNSLEVISLTDHDTVGGLVEAVSRGEKSGVRVIPGIEMSVEDKDVHILGYGIDYRNIELLTKLEEFKQSRIEGAKKMTENLKNAGFVVEWADVLKEVTGSVVARPHIARAILNRPENKEKLGSISTVHEFIEVYLVPGLPCYFRRSHISAKDAIDLIHKVGGVAVWSHPALHFSGDYEALEKFLNQMIERGLDGVEVFTSAHAEDDTEFVYGMSEKYKILRTAGSDFHAEGRPAEGSNFGASGLGDYKTYDFSTEDIIPKLDEAIEKRREYKKYD